MPQWPRIHPASWAGVAWLAVRLVTAQMVKVRHLLVPETGRMRRVTRMAWAAWGKASPAAREAACRVRCSSRPCPRPCCRSPAGMARQGRFLTWAQAGLVALHDQDVVRLLAADQEPGVLALGVHRVGGDDGPGQVQGLQ